MHLARKFLSKDQVARIKGRRRHKFSLDKLVFQRVHSRAELEKAFNLVYQAYSKKGFVPDQKPHNMLFSIYSLLPGTVHVMVRSSRCILSNLTAIPSSKVFGLPMDAVFKPELDGLRAEGRTLVELSALATREEYRFRDIFLYQIQALYWYFIYHGVDDICITVNPRHKGYYMQMFPFLELGPVRYYPRVNAPAVGLRGNVSDALERMMLVDNSLDLNMPLHHCFYELCGMQEQKKEINLGSGGDMQLLLMYNQLSSEALSYFLDLEPGIVQGLNSDQSSILRSIYPDIFGPGRLY